MIIVTGSGRCGSSLLMQTLHLLGLPLFGDPLGGEYNTLAPLDQNGNIAEQIRNKNPKGYWELDIQSVLDMCPSDFPEHEGKVMKALGGTFPSIGNEVIEKVILCLRRDRRKQAKSMHELIQLEGKIHDTTNKNLGYAGELIGKIKHWSEEDVKRSQYFSLDIITKKILEGNLPTFTIYFEDILAKPKESIKDIARFLEIENASIKKAVANIDKR